MTHKANVGEKDHLGAFVNNRKGFTLIEIIVVLIILGVLAAFALPNLFGWVAKSKVSEALVILRNNNSQIAACVQAHEAEEHLCSQTFAGNQFAYGFATVQGQGFRVYIPTSAPSPDPVNGSPNWIQATCWRTSCNLIGGLGGILQCPDCIAITHSYNGGNPTDTCSSTGTYKGIC
jgi:prepilin-type N-terminal cleavage/methylation domain-containing protein